VLGGSEYDAQRSTADVTGEAPPPPPYRPLQLYPAQLRRGDRFDDEDGEWEIVGRSEETRSVKYVVWVQHPGDPGTKREITLPAYTKIGVTRRRNEPALPILPMSRFASVVVSASELRVGDLVIDANRE